MASEQNITLFDLDASPEEGNVGNTGDTPVDGTRQAPGFRTYMFHGMPVRVFIREDGVLCLIAKDIGDILKAKNLRMAISRLDDDEKGVTNCYTLGGAQKLQYVTEAGFYRLVMRSRSPIAHGFQRWLSHDVIPSIRRDGMYATEQAKERLLTDPDMLVRIAIQYRDEHNARIKAEQALADTKAIADRQARQIEADHPDTVTGRAVSSTETMIYVRQLAKVITQSYRKHGDRHHIGQDALFQLLMDDKYVGKRGKDYHQAAQEYVEQGLFFLKESKYELPNPDGSKTPLTRTTTLVTAKGQRYFLALYGFGGSKPLGDKYL